jgi:hypothetical protein
VRRPRHPQLARAEPDEPVELRARLLERAGALGDAPRVLAEQVLQLARHLVGIAAAHEDPARAVLEGREPAIERLGIGRDDDRRLPRAARVVDPARTVVASGLADEQHEVRSLGTHGRLDRALDHHRLDAAALERGTEGLDITLAGTRDQHARAAVVGAPVGRACVVAIVHPTSS